MTNTCRFCQGETLIIYRANVKKQKRKEDLFACTNCGFGSHGEIVRCKECGLIYVNEKVSQSQISTYYEVAEDPLYFAEQNARKETFKGYLAGIERLFPNKGKLLDVGTNTGLFIRLAKDCGWDATGLEPNKWGVEYARKNYNIDLINKPFEKNVFPKESFDVITMWDVIEHFTDPISEMQKIYWYLKPGGLFAFTTVDPDSLLARLMGTNWSWYMEMHRTFLNRQAAKSYLKSIGFTNVIFRPHFRKLSLGYLATRLEAVNHGLAIMSKSLINLVGIGKVIVPYYANDLYDCYAFK